ncbi:hypothetical protein YC2023_005855 [Brassica napus]
METREEALVGTKAGEAPSCLFISAYLLKNPQLVVRQIGQKNLKMFSHLCLFSKLNRVIYLPSMDLQLLMLLSKPAPCASSNLAQLLASPPDANPRLDLKASTQFNIYYPQSERRNINITLYFTLL